MLFSRPKKVVGIDIGSHSVKTVLMSRSGGHVRLEAAGYVPVDRNRLNVDPVLAQAEAVREAVRAYPLAQCLIVGALAGHTVVIRYPRLPDMPESQLDEAIEREAGKHIPYELTEVFLDSTLLDTVTEGDDKLLKVLLVAAKHEVIDARVQVLDAAEIDVGVLGVDSLALADAAEGCDFLRVGETVALVNIGLTSTSVHFVNDGVSNFIRDVNWGAKELIQAIARSRRCDYEQAEAILCSAADEEEMAQQPPAPESEAGAIPAAEPEPVSGGSLLDPFEDELDATAPASAEPASTGASGEQDLRETLAAPLSRLVNEVRRSFEYYEHELYESPVDRMILSGGVAHLSILSSTLGDELGIQGVEVANPLESALFLGDDRDVAPLAERPAQFLVAVGLAARGIADL
ncbi:MAG: type IV pilus assembly protein PilM [Nitrospiraceae bacterium]|nr:type IV pilus assembly protein PilM [Nitrospiraceae bacterium]